jgi:hypothetical protein
MALATRASVVIGRPGETASPAITGRISATVTVTSSLLDTPVASVTVRRNSRAVETEGAVKFGYAVSPLNSVTVGPESWVQTQVMGEVPP